MYLFREMLGLTSIYDRFLYVTDGGDYDTSVWSSSCAVVAPRSTASTAVGTRAGLSRTGEAVALARGDWRSTSISIPSSSSRTKTCRAKTEM